MIKILRFILLFLFFLFFVPPVFAQNFVSVVNPVRGNDFWDLKGQSLDTAVKGELEILKKYNIPATWLLRYDALLDKGVSEKLKSIVDEKGLFLEVTPTWSQDAFVLYHKGESWHSAGSAFLTGYGREEREKLIDKSFEKFKEVFGFYPKSVGAWWIDAYSLSYMQKKYSIISALIVADQYSTDNYQIWGQYFSTSYYPSKNNALHPAQTLENKLPVVITQWASRDPVNSYGNGVGESTYSLQANDYQDFHNLDIGYFTKLIDIYSKQPLNKFSHIVVGLENSYSWQKYFSEYENQIKVIAQKQNSNQISTVTLESFANWYKLNFPNLSPEHLIVADDPLGSFKKTVWFMNPYFRAGWFFNQDGSVFRDIRQYIDGEEELCFKVRCDSVNFATTATRVLDEVSFGHKWVIDEGRIKNFQIKKEDQNYLITYDNEVGRKRQIEFLPRDISVDGKNYSIDGAILEATKQDLDQKKIKSQTTSGFFRWSPISTVAKLIKFTAFFLASIFVPGFLIIRKVFPKEISLIQRIFVSIIVGIVLLTLLFYLSSLFKIRLIILIYLFLANTIFLKIQINNIKKMRLPKIKNWFDLGILLIIISGSIFQVIPTFRSGLFFSYGMGFWGPNTHDGIWHISLINQIVKSLPVENPIYAETFLKNYHYFYDILIALSNYLTKIPIPDLVFRFYPVIFSLLLGVGTFQLINNLFKVKLNLLQFRITALFSLYLVYFSGSFGWIVSFLKEKSLSGESAFWANQSNSFNLNPPFALSLLIVIAILLIFPLVSRNNKSLSTTLILLIGSLISFKAYASILILASLFVISLVNIFLKRSFTYLFIFTISSAIALWLFVLNFEQGTSLIIFSPFWFIHSMIDSPDRVGWMRLALARNTGFTQGTWFKFLSVEFISLLIFIIGNLGMRFFALFSLIKIKIILKDTTLLFILIFTLISMLIPVFFIQSGNPWNTIQFFYYALFINALAAGIVISRILLKLPNIFKVAVAALILSLTPINSWASVSGYLTNSPHAKISTEELQALDFLSRQDDGVVLTYPYDKNLKKKIEEPWPLYAYDSTAYVSALTKKRVYLEDEGQNQILLTNYNKRLIASRDFFARADLKAVEFLKINQIKYIYLPKVYNLIIDQNTLGISNIFENNEVVIYKSKI